MNKVYLVSKDGKQITYDQLLYDLNQCEFVSQVCYQKDTYSIFLEIIASALHGITLTILDADFSSAEIEALEISEDTKSRKVKVQKLLLACIDDLIAKILSNQDWELELFTSGTTGVPKKAKHKLATFTRYLRKSAKHSSDVWGFAYNPTHIAGIQVFFQAFLNANTIVDIFGMNRETILSRINEHGITNLSATPTYYRMLFPTNNVFLSIRRITSGGERFDPKLTASLLRVFPNAKISNVYASTEAGTILESRGEYFSISDASYCKIENNRLYIRAELLGMEIGQIDWYDTGDLVEFVDNDQEEFRFVGRDNEMINVGGYKANPSEIEHALCDHPDVLQAKVWGKTNPVTGTILMAEVICSNQLTERQLRDHLKGLLQDFKIPRVIYITNEISTTRSGKIKRT